MIRMSNVLAGIVTCIGLFCSPLAAAAEYTLSGEVTMPVGAFEALTPAGTPVLGPIVFNDAALGGTAGIPDVTSIDVNVGGFCFSTNVPSNCPNGGADVPISSIDAAAIDLTNPADPGGTLNVTAFSPTFGIFIPIMFDFTAGTFFANGGGLGTVSGTSILTAPPTISVAPNPAAFADTVNGNTSSVDVVVSNAGGGTLDITSVAAVDTLAAPFSITADGCSGMSLDSSTTCTIQVQFAPTAGGNFSDSFDVVSTDASNPSTTVNVQGTGLVPDIAVAPSPVNFSSTTVGESSNRTVTVTNNGGATLNVGTLGTPTDSQFAVTTDNCSGMALAPAAQCTFVLTFSPAAAGMFTATMSVPSNDPDTPSVTLTMNGSGTIAQVAEIEVDNTSLVFDELLVGQSSSAAVTVTSTGNADLVIASVVFAGADAADFTQANDCPAALAPDDSCIITVIFEPLTGGVDKNATLTITSNADLQPMVDIDLSAAAFDGARIEVDPTELDFGSPSAPIDVGATTTASTTVTNTGNADLVVDSITFSASADEFMVLTQNCSEGVAPGDSCTITVEFAPLTEDDKMGTMTLNSNDAANGSTVVTLNGFVFRGPRISVASLVVDVDGAFSTEVGRSANTDIEVHSTGTEDLLVASAVLGGANPDQFSLTDSCSGNPVAPGSSCTIRVTFAPDSAGIKTATLTLTSNDVSVTTVIALSGTGFEPPPPPPPPLSVPPDFATKDVGGVGSSGPLLLLAGLGLWALRRRRINTGVKMAKCLLAVTAVGAIGLSQPAGAISFESESGDLYGSWDTTLSYGLAMRMEAAADDLIGTVNGGTKYSVNGDDGTLNYNRGIFSNALKATSELEVNYTPWNLSFFTRAFYVHDFEAENGARERTPLSKATLDKVGSYGDLLDAFISWKFDIGDRPAEFRIGEQVINWGESTFIQGGMNVINHINVAALRVPGAELREALLPQDMVYFSVGLTPNLDIEVVYQYDWDDFEPDPVGSYFSTNDFAVDGGTAVRLGFGDTPDTPNPSFFPFERAFNAIPRGPAIEPDDAGQWGFATRYFAEDLNNGTEFGFYYYNYHSRLPLISAQTGSYEGFLVAASIGASPGLGGAADIAAAAGQYIAANPGDVDGAIAAGIAAANPTLPAYIPVAIAGTAATGGNVSGLATALATDAFANVPSTGNDPFNSRAGDTARYFTVFPEDIQLYGLSWNTTLGQTAWQGEVAHHKNRPLQVDDLELLFAGLSTLRPQFAQLGQLGSFSFSPLGGQFNPNTPPLTPINGYIRRDYTQTNMAFTRLFGPMLGADQGVLLFEVAHNHVHNFPRKSVLRLDGPATVVSGNPALAELAHPGKPLEPESNFPDAGSWGYRLAGRLDFSNLFGAINMSPRFAFQHDVDGITPGPAGAFIEGRKALSLGSRFAYQNTWEFDVSYSWFWGAGRQNEISDRDFVAASIKYTF